MTEKTKMGRGTITIDGERLATETFSFDGDTYTMRELNADESDEAWDAAQNPDKTVNGRLNSRLLLARSLVAPTVTADGAGKWGNRKYTVLLGHFNRLNSIDEANPTPPAGSAGPTPPAGGESSPTS